MLYALNEQFRLSQAFALKNSDVSSKAAARRTFKPEKLNAQVILLHAKSVEQIYRARYAQN
ncbi:hypothetical protein BCT11_25850 [Vibrio sp. 10N.222.52.B12]|nr:hypothetical protein BCT11_25850 [Vibrio sp. 10N.222.52.B12]